MQITHSTVEGVVAIESDQLVVTNHFSFAVFVTFEKSDITHVSVQLFVTIFIVFIVETLIWVDVHILVNSINGQDIVVDISLVMDVTFGPAFFSKPFKTPVHEYITFGSILVEMKNSSWTVSSLQGIWIIIMLVMSWLIKANGMATFFGKRNSFVAAWIESGGIRVINPQELIG